MTTNKIDGGIRLDSTYAMSVGADRGAQRADGEPGGVVKSDLLTRKEAALYLSVQEQTLAKWKCRRTYELPVVLIGSDLLP